MLPDGYFDEAGDPVAAIQGTSYQKNSGMR